MCCAPGKVAVADEIAAASLAMGQGAEGRPAVLVRRLGDVVTGGARVEPNRHKQVMEAGAALSLLHAAGVGGR